MQRDYANWSVNWLHACSKQRSSLMREQVVALKVQVAAWTSFVLRPIRLLILK